MINPSIKLMTPTNHKKRDHNHYTLILYNKENDSSSVLGKDKSFIIFSILNHNENWVIGNIRREVFFKDILFDKLNKLS